MRVRSPVKILSLAIIVTLFVPLLLYLSLGSTRRTVGVSDKAKVLPRPSGRKANSLDSLSPVAPKSPKDVASEKLPPSTVGNQPARSTPSHVSNTATTTSLPTQKAGIESSKNNLNQSDSLGQTDILDKTFIESLNVLERVYNADKYPALSSEDIVFVVQVHKRVHYLKYLIESFSKARDIGKVLLIFSHDYYDTEINSLVQSIDFCKVLQLFFPYSLQLHPDTFPGESPGDCGPDLTRQQGEHAKCSNWEHPDRYGHYRTAAVTAIKHHWWWKINQVFDGLKLTNGFNGTVFFIEEDHYISPDAVVVAKQLINLRNSNCPQCDFVNLGMYTGNSPFSSHANKAYSTVWFSAKHNMGFGMDRKSWNRVKGCSAAFCDFDDYNWDWSMCSLSKACLKPPLRVLLLPAPRIFHAGTCGTHQKKVCDWDRDIRRIQTTLQSNAGHLFPASLEVGPESPASRSHVGRIQGLKGYGGWADPRDVVLCKSFVH